MNVEGDYAIAFATHIDWLKNLAPVLQPRRSKSKANRKSYARFFPRFEQVIGNILEFWTIYRAVLIGQNNFWSGIGFSIAIWKPL